jgi:hypothetical protein
MILLPRALQATDAESEDAPHPVSGASSPTSSNSTSSHSASSHSASSRSIRKESLL